MGSLGRIERAPMMASDPRYLADIYGGGLSLDDFADSLEGPVADQVVGVSEFALAIAERRQDQTKHENWQEYGRRFLVKAQTTSTMPSGHCSLSMP